MEGGGGERHFIPSLVSLLPSLPHTIFFQNIYFSHHSLSLTIHPPPLSLSPRSRKTQRERERRGKGEREREGKERRGGKEDYIYYSWSKFTSFLLFLESERGGGV